MKHTRSTLRRLLTLCLALTMTLGCLVGGVTLSALAEDNILSDEPVRIEAFEGNGPSPKQITSDYCIRIGYGAPFDQLVPTLCTWGQTNARATLALYRWIGSYNDTVATEPVAKMELDPVGDNSYPEFSFDEQPAGEYLFRIFNISGTVGVYTRPSSRVTNAYFYESGRESQNDDWWMSVHFTKTPEVPFLKIESAMAVIDGKHKPPEEPAVAEDSLLATHKVMPDTWVFTDGLGRVSLTNAEEGDPREDRTVGIFYWTWHLSSDPAFNVQDFMEQYPEAVNDYDHPAWPTDPVAYYWNQPIYGYYRTDDAWVLRRQAELLANAGVDAIFTDNTNGAFTWKEGYDVLYPTWESARAEGAVRTPKVSFTLPFYPFDSSYEQITGLYLDIYRPDRYQDLWFYWDGKPMLMGCNDHFTSGETPLRKEIGKFFTFRSTLIGGDETSKEYKKTGQWGWLAAYPQPAFYGTIPNYRNKVIEQMTVGIAQNRNYVTGEGTAMNGENVSGRSYSSTEPERYLKEGGEASGYGYFFAEQFEYAIEKDPRMIFITGWNEWTAGRQREWGGVPNAFADEFTDEYSRDIEPSKGALQDHYYYQMVNYIRQYKGCTPIPEPNRAKTIDLEGGLAQWRSVEPYYAAYIGNTVDRDAQGRGVRYTETSGRNDIVGAKVARDDEYVYFYVECNDSITPYTDDLWMTLYIDSDQDNQGWNTFEYVINKSPAGKQTLVLERFTGENDYAATEKVADVAYKVRGKTMTVQIPKEALGLEGYDFTINFTWTDNVHDEGDYTTFSGDIMDFYISGDVAPGGRFKYSYISTAENAAGRTDESETGSETPAETSADTSADTSVDTTTETDATEETTSVTTDEDTEVAADTTAGAAAADTTASDETSSGETSSGETDGGCRSAIGKGGVLVPLTVLPAALPLLRKRRRKTGA